MAEFLVTAWNIHQKDGLVETIKSLHAHTHCLTLCLKVLVWAKREEGTGRETSFFFKYLIFFLFFPRTKTDKHSPKRKKKQQLSWPIASHSTKISQVEPSTL